MPTGVQRYTQLASTQVGDLQRQLQLVLTLPDTPQEPMPVERRIK